MMNLVLCQTHPARHRNEPGNRVNQIENHNTAEQAAYWIARLSSDQQTAGDRKRFSDWIETNEENGAAFDHVLDTWNTCAFLPAAATAANEETHTQTNRSQLSFLSWPTAIAASVMCFIAVSLFQLQQPSTTSTTQDYMTAVGEFKTIELKDGSVIELNTNSKISIAYSEQTRNIELVKGEAYFEVAKNKNAPFVVTTRDASVTALGTAFNIHSSSKSSHVIVTEGVVAVEETSNQALKGERAIVKAGHSINVDKKTGINSVSATLPQDSDIPWRKRTLILENIPLNTALEKLNRYLKVPVDNSHQSLGTKMVSGTFSLEQPEATLSALIESFHLKSNGNTHGKGPITYYISE